MADLPSSFYLVYTSRASNLMSSSDLLELLKNARGKNLTCDITGMLLYMETRFMSKLEGRFMQIIEGTEENVLTLYEKIKKDPRNGGIVLLATGKQECSNFSDWSMAFVAEEDLTTTSPGYKILDKNLFEYLPFDNYKTPTGFLKEFYQYNTELQDEYRHLTEDKN